MTAGPGSSTSRLLRPGRLYTNDPDEHLRFLFLTHAAIELCRRREWAPAIAHGNDWQTGMLPLYLKSIYARRSRCSRRPGASSPFTTLATRESSDRASCPTSSWVTFQYLLHQDHLRQGRVSFMEHALLYADAITTVSPTYAREIQTPEHGAGLDGLLRLRSSELVGILNGIDLNVWNPRTDRYLPRPVLRTEPRRQGRSTSDTCSSPAVSTRTMDVPLLGVVTRLTGQKGVELMIRPLARLLSRGPDPLRRPRLRRDASSRRPCSGWRPSFPGRASFHRGYDEPLAHLIEGGADVFLMPSLYEPSGLNQMYSLAYGTAPDRPPDRWSGRHGFALRSWHRRGNRLRLRSLLRGRA